MAYRVTAPYVVIKYIGTTGSAEVRGFYDGAYLPDSLDPDNLKHHLDNNMVEEVDDPEVPEGAEPEGAPLVAPPADEPPKGNASRDEWAAYANTKGASEEETRPVEEGGLKQTELREKYGN